MNQLDQRQQGQALIIVAFAVIALVGFLAMAVDGSMIYGQRRQAQNAADAAAIAATYHIRIQNNSFTRNEQQVLAKANERAEAHDIPDTDGQPGNAVNGNVNVFYTDNEGNILLDGVAPCRVGSCPLAIASAAWGVQVQVQKPFETYFAGVVGWKEATVGALATAVTHNGASHNNDYFALFGDDRNNCGGESVKVTGSTINLTGNIHSNADVKINPSGSGNAGTVNFGDISYTGRCNGCDKMTFNGGVNTTRNPITNLVYTPSYETFRSIANQKSQTVEGQRFGSIDVGNGATFTLGTPAAPYTYIDGNLRIRNGALVTIYGLVFVTGDVQVAGNAVVSSSPNMFSNSICGGGIPGLGRFSIVAGGEIDIQQTGAAFSGGPFVDPSNELANNTITLFTNKNGGCQAPVLKMSASANSVYGSIVAPNGEIDISGSSNYIFGALIGNRISLSGSTSTVFYKRECFPPQPDRIELLE